MFVKVYFSFNSIKLMYPLKISTALSLIIIYCNSLTAQQIDGMFIRADSSKLILTGQDPQQHKGPFVKPYILPAVMIGYGFIGIKSDPLKDVDESIQRKIWVDNPHRSVHVDNYLQFAPAAAVYALNIIGVNGKHNFRDRSMIYFISNVFMNVAVSSVKGLTHEIRPDGSDRLSFPSGHTAEAFASAEFLREEYKVISPWYGIGGYLTAGATGLLRMYNNKHWLNDIIAGAGFGIASTKLAYWVYPAISKKLFHMNAGYTTILPYYHRQEAGLDMLYVFH
jgi:membrane-associated phospholipid phosphatase